MDQMQAHASEFQMHAAFMQGRDEAGFEKIRQADSTEASECGQQQQQDYPDGKPEAAEGDTAFTPEASHIDIRECSLE
jgi:hypothetical protein